VIVAPKDIEIMTATLDVTELRKQFSIGRPAIDGVSFAVPAGEIVVLLGPSGCGKTTTLRCVAGLEHPTSGEISIAGHLVSSPARGILVPPRLRDIGMVFQSYAVWPHMTVRQNVIYPLRAIRSGSRRQFLCRVKVAGRIVTPGHRLTNSRGPMDHNRDVRHPA
jgi:multiple sugar transport system ATP-binding protein